MNDLWHTQRTNERRYETTRGLMLSLSLVAGCGGSNGDDPQHLATALLGTWKSNQCEAPSTELSQRRTYIFSSTSVDISYDVYAGTACEAGPKTLTVTTRGDAQFTTPAVTPAGATDVVFTFTGRAITPTDDGVALLQQACGQYAWVSGVQTDVTQNGCGTLVQSDTDCPVEYDLAEIISGVAFFGDRSHPLCSVATRPTKLAMWGVVKQP